MAPLETPLRPDRLVALLDKLCGTSGAGMEDLRNFIDDATGANLTLPDLEVPEGFDPELIGEDEANEVTRDPRALYAYQLHQWAYAVTGATAKARTGLAQIGLSDGETRGSFDGVVQPDRVGELVEAVTDRLAREAAGEPGA